MATEADVQNALKIGQEMAEAAVAKRRRLRERRAAALTAHKSNLAGIMAPESIASLDTAGVLVAEGDSWFDYPFCDVLKILEDDYAYDVVSVAHKGDAVEEMAYAGDQLDDFTRHIDKLIDAGKVPKAILLSGGGNDVAGDGFGMLLNHFNSPIKGLNAKVVDGILQDRILVAYVTILKSVTESCVKLLGKPIPILTHGYDYPVPDGRGFWGGAWILPGPWLEPGFRQKGFASLNDRKEIAKHLIDLFNDMLGRIVARPEFGHVTHIDLRGTLRSDDTYKKWWDNELHPSPDGFQAVAAKFAQAI